MNSSQKLIRSSEIPREPPHQIGMRSNPWFVRYCAHKLFGRPSWKMAAYGAGSNNEGPKSRRYEVIALTSHFGFRDLVTLKLGQGD